MYSFEYIHTVGYFRHKRREYLESPGSTSSEDIELSWFDKEERFFKSLEVVVSCLTDDVADKSIFLSAVQMLTENVQTKDVDFRIRYDSISLDVKESKKLYSIYKHMVNIFKCNDNELRSAFRHIHVGNFHVNDLEMIKCVKYFGSIHTIILYKMKLNVNDARREFESIDYGECGFLYISSCELEDNDVGIEKLDSKLYEVDIRECTLKNVNSLLNAFHWAMSTSRKQLRLHNLKIMDGWWSALVAAIEQGMSNGKGNLQVLSIYNCPPQMSRNLQKKVR